MKGQVYISLKEEASLDTGHAGMLIHVYIPKECIEGGGIVGLSAFNDSVPYSSKRGNFNADRLPRKSPGRFLKGHREL